MKFISTPISDLYVIEPIVWKDDRGYFYESYAQRYFDTQSIVAQFVQDNQSLSQRGTLRGLHAQKAPFAQGKLVRVLTGSVLDVAVDIRPASSSFGKHFKVHLSGENHKMLWIPAGFLHGFVTLEDNTIFTYKVTAPYDKTSEVGVIWNDNNLNIDWEIPYSEIILSEKDMILPSFDDFCRLQF